MITIVWAIIRKDVAQMSRDRFFAYITILGLVAYVALFWGLPSTVDETLNLGIHGVGADLLAEQLGAEEGLDLEVFDTSDALEQAVTDGDLVAGVDFPNDFLPAVTTGNQATVTVYVPADTTDDIRTAISGLVRELAYLVAGSALPITPPAEDEIILGPDRAGDQVPLKDKMRPLLAVFLLMMEMMSLASLIAQEIRSKTVTAVLVTPARTTDFLAAKTILGTALAFTEVVLLMVAIGAFGSEPLVLLTALLLAAFLVTGLALLAGSTGRDFIEILLLSVALIVPMMIPAGAALFPGSAAPWIKVLPSYGMTQAIVRASAYGAGWAETAPYLLMTLAWCVGVFAVGVFALKRKVETL
ncbi:MAG: ABC transporter permease [Acidimicrobiia bacterium]